MALSLHEGSTVLSLWRMDPYWSSQFGVEYSSDLFTCMVLGDQLHEEGTHQHMGRCRSNADVGEAHPSLGELAPPFILSLRMGGGISMSHSTYMSRADGKNVSHIHSDFYLACILLLTISVQDIAPRRGIPFLRLLGSLETTSRIMNIP